MDVTFWVLDLLYEWTAVQAERNASAHVIAEAQPAEPELKRGNWFKEQKFNN